MKLNIAQAALLLLTMAAAGIGAWFYFEQLSITPIWLWLFVPDCPLYALLAAPILLLGFPKNALLRFAIASGLAIFGSWTMFVLALHADTYFNAANLPLSLVLVAGHFGMVAEGVLCLPKKEELRYGALLITIGWFLLNVQFDYLNGAQSTHPWIPAGQIGIVMLYTVFSSITWPVSLYAAAGLAEKEKSVRIIRAALRISN